MSVDTIEAGSPDAVSGGFKTGQVIESINGRKLMDIDPRIQLGQIIAQAEAPDGTVRFMVKVTHATLLRAAGYQTAYFGKWHMGNQRSRPGFAHAASFVGQGIDQDCPFEINGVAKPTNGWVDDVSTDFAIDWIKQNRDKPFSAVVGYKTPHNRRGGENLPERLRGLYAGKASRPVPNLTTPAIYHKADPATGAFPSGLADNEVHLDYCRHIKGVDENLEKLLATLDELGLAEDTVVVFTSDNGYFLGEHGSGDKRALYEESLRIPMLARYPRLFGKGLTVDEMVLQECARGQRHDV
jgi:arylsulfatase A-like enzyme